MTTFATYLQVSLLGAGLIGALLLLSKAMGRNLASRYKQWAWLFIALRLMVPLSVSLPEAPVKVTVPDLHAPVRMYAGQAASPASMPETQGLAVPNPSGIAHTQSQQQPSATPITATAEAPSRLQIALWLWLAGVAAIGLHEIVGYTYARRRLTRWSFPVEEGTSKILDSVRKDMHIRKHLPLRQSAAIHTPMIIGLLHPVLLLPERRYDVDDLRLIFRHEFTHYQRGDMWYKFVLLLARVLHWFNPLVYVMYRKADVDMEFACDEAVLRAVGAEHGRRYGETILAAAGTGGGYIPALSTHFLSEKRNLANRIRNIMHTRKRRFGAMIVAACMCFALLGGMMVSFAAESTEADAFSPDASVTAVYGKLWGLRPEACREMTVSEFRDAVHKKMNEDEMAYLSLYDVYDEQIDEMRYTDDGASFLYNTLFPLTAEKWETWRFPTYVGLPGADVMPAEYEVTSHILNPDTLTVGAFEEATVGIMEAINTSILAHYADGMVDAQALEEDIATLTATHSNDALEVSVFTVFIPTDDLKDTAMAYETVEESIIENTELRLPPASQEDYDAVLSLKTPGYDQMTVAAFEEIIQSAFRDEASPLHGALERVMLEASGKYPETLSPEDRDFLFLTLDATIRDYVSENKSQYSPEPVYPVYQGYYFGSVGSTDSAAIQYDIEYEILKPEEMKVAERDGRLSQVIGGMEDYLYQSESAGWQGGKPEMDAMLAGLCAEASDSLMEIRPVKTYFSVDPQDVQQRQQGAYLLVEKMAALDTTPSIDAYKAELTKIVEEAGTNIFETMSDASRAYDENDPLYPFFTGSLMVTSSELFAEEMGGEERAYMLGHAVQERYIEKETYGNTAQSEARQKVVK